MKPKKQLFPFYSKGRILQKLLPDVKHAAWFINNWVERYQNPFVPRRKHDAHVEEYNLWLDGDHPSLYTDGNHPDFYQPKNTPDGDWGFDRDVVCLEDY